MRLKDLLIRLVLRLVGCWLVLSVVACTALSSPDGPAQGLGPDAASAADNNVKAAWVQYLSLIHI